MMIVRDGRWCGKSGSSAHRDRAMHILDAEIVCQVKISVVCTLDEEKYVNNIIDLSVSNTAHCS